MKEHRGSFRATGSDGLDYEIDIWVELLDASDAKNPGATRDGKKSLRTKNGKGVKRISQGKYRIAQTRVDLASDDPDAP